MLDYLQILFWTITYGLIVFYSIRYYAEHQILMPILAGSLNLAWEANALIGSNGFWGHVVWLLLDIIIYWINVSEIQSIHRKLGYLLWTIASFTLLYFIFRIPNVNGKLVSVYIIDMIMAAEYLICIKKISLRGKKTIAITKLIGDLCAWLFYYKYSWIVGVSGFIVLILNLTYLITCFENGQCKRRGI